MSRLPSILLLLTLASTALPAQDTRTAPLLVPDEPTTPFDRLAALAEDERAVGERFRDFLDAYHDYILEQDPELATRLDAEPPSRRWRSAALVVIQRQEREARQLRTVLETLDAEALPGPERLDYEALAERLELAAEDGRFPDELQPISHVIGLHLDAPQLLSRMPRRDADDLEAILDRLRALPRRINQTLVLLARGLEQGVTPPRSTLREVPQQVRALLTEDPLASPLLEPFRHLPRSLAPSVERRLREEAAGVYHDAVRPAFEQLHRYLTITYLPAARAATAWSALPDGKAWYAHRVRRALGREATPRELHELGLAEVERLRRALEEEMRSADLFSGDLTAFNELLRSHSGFYFERSEDLLRAYRDAAKRADAALLELVDLPPRLPWGLAPLPPHRVGLTASEYVPGSLAARRPGRLYVDLSDLRAHPTWCVDAVVLRHGVPGRHLLHALTAEAEGLAWFRRLDQPAFSEGWGLYASSLGALEGFDDDPWNRLGAIGHELWQALLVVADTGLHAFGWERQQAMDYLFAHSGRSRRQVGVTVDRMLVEAADALAPTVGLLKLRELRSRAEEALGEAFDRRAFHSALLAGGALPPRGLDREVESWIAERALSP